MDAGLWEAAFRGVKLRALGRHALRRARIAARRAPGSGGVEVVVAVFVDADADRHDRAREH
jgi:hypothetical protein